MRNKLMLVVSLVVSLTACTGKNDPVYVEGEHKFWSHVKDPVGNVYAAPEVITWAVDPKTCGDRTSDLESGLLNGSKFWSAKSGVVIQKAVPNEQINFVMYCAPFGKFNGKFPLAYRVRMIEAAPDMTIKRIAVEVPNDWNIVYDQMTVDFTPMSYSPTGVGYLTLGLALGVKHDYDPGRSSAPPQLDERLPYTQCVKNCDT